MTTFLQGRPRAHAPVDPHTNSWCLVGELLPSMADAGEWAVTPACGALVTFTGVVRDHSSDMGDVVAIEYEVYQREAVQRLEAIARTALAIWPKVERIALWHRTGLVNLSEPSVFVAASAHHRADSFRAAEFCIDVVKRTVPVWKNEHGAATRGWVTTGVEPISVESAAASWIDTHLRDVHHVA